MTPMQVQDAKREEGFTLIELLVVVIIIGILAAIAIPVFMNQRERAWVSAAESDVRNAALSVETYYTEFQAYPAALGDFSGDVETSTDVTLGYSRASDGNSYELFACHSRVEDDCTTVSASNNTAHYNSASGGLQK